LFYFVSLPFASITKLNMPRNLHTTQPLLPLPPKQYDLLHILLLFGLPIASFFTLFIIISHHDHILYLGIFLGVFLLLTSALSYFLFHIAKDLQQTNTSYYFITLLWILFTFFISFDIFIISLLCGQTWLSFTPDELMKLSACVFVNTNLLLALYLLIIYKIEGMVVNLYVGILLTLCVMEQYDIIPNIHVFGLWGVLSIFFHAICLYVDILHLVRRAYSSLFLFCTSLSISCASPFVEEALYITPGSFLSIFFFTSLHSYTVAVDLLFSPTIPTIIAALLSQCIAWGMLLYKIMKVEITLNIAAVIWAMNIVMLLLLSCTNVRAKVYFLDERDGHQTQNESEFETRMVELEERRMSERSPYSDSSENERESEEDYDISENEENEDEENEENEENENEESEENEENYVEDDLLR
jgi:hypothetical protein